MAENVEATCVICEKDMDICCTTNCGHTTCEDCVLKYFVLEQKSTCILCREVDPKFGFYKYVPGVTIDYNACNVQQKIGTKKFNFQNHKVYNKVLSRMSYKCPKDGRIFTTFDGIKNHVNKDHDDYIRVCTLCCKSNKILPCETEYFSSNQDLQRHIIQGKPEIGFEGHPSCKFCPKERFYSSDELNDHMAKSRHVSCYVCKEIPSVLQKDSWFLDSLALDTHLKKSHFACYKSECPLTAFATRNQLEMHDVETHGITNANFLYSVSSNSDIIQNRETSQTANEESTFADNSELGMRRLRFKERARHYWGQSPEKMNVFFESNDFYLKNAIKISELTEIYKSLFVKNEKEEEEENKNLSRKQKQEKEQGIRENISLLLKNFAETLANKKGKYLELVDYSKKLAPNKEVSNPSNEKSFSSSLDLKVKQISLSSSTLQSAQKIQPKVFQPLPTLPGLNSSASLTESPYFKSTTTESKNQKLPSLQSLSDVVKKKTASTNPNNKNILTGAGLSLLNKKSSSNKSQSNALPTLSSLSSDTLSDFLPSSNQSIQIIQNNTPLVRNQAVIHSNNSTGSLPGLPKLAKQENAKAKEIRMKILQKKQKNSKNTDSEMSVDYQSRLADIRGKSKKIEERGLMKEWSRI
ncbi:hypothetical protein QEN19_000888 [Hanseniaspora menglaensis]